MNISQKGKLADKNSSKQFVWIKLATTTIFLVEVINSKEQEKRKIWSRGANSRLPFAVNVTLNREVKHHVYVKLQTRICTTWPSFPFTCRLLFIASTNKWVVSRNFLSRRIFGVAFICSFSILRNSQLESGVCRLPFAVYLKL